MVFIGPVFHYTSKTCLKRVWHGGYEWEEKEMCRFAEDMSKQAHCTYERYSVCAHVCESVSCLLNSCALPHWLSPTTNDIDFTLLACLYARFHALSSGINPATFPAQNRFFTRLPPRSTRIKVHQAWLLFTLQLVLYLHHLGEQSLKRVGHGGYEWVEKEISRFAEDMS